jgi:hypothetical protein
VVAEGVWMMTSSSWLVMVMVMITQVWASPSAIQEQQQFGWGSTAQRNGLVSNMSPIIPSTNNTQTGIVVIGSSKEYAIQRKLCDTGYVDETLDPLSPPIVVPTISFIVHHDDYDATPSVYVMVDRCWNVKGTSLFGLSHHGDPDIVFRGHWSSFRTSQSSSSPLGVSSSFAWRINSTSVVATGLYDDTPSIVILSLPIIMTTKDHEMESPKCIIPLSQSMDDIVMISHNSSIGIATNNKTLTIIAFDINDCSLKWNVSLSYLSFDPFNSTISLVHWMSRVAINNDATIAFSVVAANNSLILIAFDLNNGNELWRYIDPITQPQILTQVQVSSGATIGPQDQVCYGSPFSLVCLMSTNGHLLWSKSMSDYCLVTFRWWSTIWITSTSLITSTGGWYNVTTGAKQICPSPDFLTMRVLTSSILPQHDITLAISKSVYYQYPIEGGSPYWAEARHLVDETSMQPPEMIVINNRTIMIGRGTVLMMAMPSRTLLFLFDRCCDKCLFAPVFVFVTQLVVVISKTTPINAVCVGFVTHVVNVNVFVATRDPIVLNVRVGTSAVPTLTSVCYVVHVSLVVP